MLKKIFIWLLFYQCLPQHAFPQNKELSQYDVLWTTQSNNAAESMPCGGGDIGLNVWVENSEIFIYAARSGSFDENNGLLKSGRIRLTILPGILDGSEFLQQLHLLQGYVSIYGKKNGIDATIKIRADVFAPVVHIDVKSSEKISLTATYESWRYHDRILQPRENFGNSWKQAAPENNICKKDDITFVRNKILFYHHNTGTTIFDTTVSQQGLQQVKDSLYNPLAYLCFGGSLKGKNFTASGTYKGVYVNTDYEGWKLKSISPAKDQSLQLTLWTSQVQDISAWKHSLDSLENETTENSAKALKKTQDWWQQFWARSFIIINSNDTISADWQAGRNFQLFRYMLACNAKSKWPTKFNGGLFTVDPVFTDSAAKLTPDFRNWGGGLHTAQNQRLVYFPMIKNGDWDALQAQLDFYLRILKNAELRTRVYWNHDGACFTEQMENYGLPDFAEYGLNRPGDLDPGIEYNPWLEYLWDTSLEFCLMMLEEQRYTGKNISDKIPFIESCLRFFDEHYQYLSKKRGAKIFDENGKLILYPGSGAETFKMAYNSTSTIAALQTISKRLLELPNGYLTENEKKEWQQFAERIPAINFRSFNGHTTISPAKLWARINNEESPQLYPVYPWGIFGLGKPGLDTAVNTWRFDTSVIKFRNYIGWKQDNIFAARLGLINEAWELTSSKLNNSSRRFPAFWGPGFDWAPDHNWGGSGMIGLQEMLMQTDDRRILLFPSWPTGKDVHFKLNAPYNTTVEAVLKDKKITLLKVSPEERRKDVEIFIK